METNKYLLKHTAAIHIANALTLTQRKVTNILLKHAFHELDKDIIHKISLSNVMNFLGWGENSEATKLLRDSLKNLNVKQLEWNIFNKDRKQVWGVTTLLAYVQIANGVVEYSYSKPLRELLYRPNIYAKLDLLVQKNFSNKHALALWEYVCEYLCSSKTEEIQTDEMTIEDFKKFLGLENHKTYTSFSALNAQVITIALSEINQESDIQVEALFKKQGKKVTSLSFVGRRKNLQQNPASDVEREKTHSNVNITKEAIQLGISAKILTQHVQEYGKERVQKALSIVTEDLRNGKKIYSVQAYYVSCLKNDWQRSLSSSQIDLTDEQILIQTTAEDKVYSRQRNILIEQLGTKTYKSWFQEVEFEITEDHKLFVRAPSRFCADYISTHFSSAILGAWNTSGNNISQLVVAA